METLEWGCNLFWKFPSSGRRIENIVASVKRSGGEGFENVELSDIAELFNSHPQKIVEKYFRDVIISKVDKKEVIIG